MSEQGKQGAPEWTPERIQQVARDFQTCRILSTGVELGLFTALDDGKRTSTDVARETGTDARATDRIMNALCALGLLNKDGVLFANGTCAAKHLVKGKPEYLSGLGHIFNLWDTWATLTEAVRRGTCVDRGSFEERGDAWFESFIEAMHFRGRAEAEKFTELIDWSGVSKLLDVGGGSAVFSMAFVKANEGMQATVFDLPKVVPLTRKYIEREGLSDRVSAVPGDYLKDDLPGGFDMVFLSAIVHANSSDENVELIRKSAAALNPGGRVVVSEFIMNEDRVGPPFGALFALNMLVNTRGGDTFTESEIRGWYESAGLTSIDRIATGFNAELIVGRKA